MAHLAQSYKFNVRMVADKCTVNVMIYHPILLQKVTQGEPSSSSTELWIRYSGRTRKPEIRPSIKGNVSELTLFTQAPTSVLKADKPYRLSFRESRL
jgi:hypothetical protein